MNRPRLGSLVKLSARLAFICSLAGPAAAEEVFFDFSGAITDVTQTGATPAGGPYDVSLGETFSGRFSYNSDTPAASEPGDNVFADSTAQISVTIGSTTFGELFVAQSGSLSTYQEVEYDGSDNGQFNNYFTTQISSYATNNGIETDAGITVYFDSLTASPLGILPSSGLPTALNLADFNSYHAFDLDEQVWSDLTDSALSDYLVEGNITSLTLVSSSVPEPSTIVMLGVGLAISTAGYVLSGSRL